MATVRLIGRSVTIDLAWWERLFTGRRRLVVPLDQLAAVDVVEHPTRWTATPGGRSGLVVGGVVKVGRWGLGTSQRTLVAARRRVPAIRLTLTPEFADEAGYDAALISTRDATAVVASLTGQRA